MEGFSAGAMGGATGLCGAAVGAACACSIAAERKSTGKSASATLVRNDLKNNRIVQLRILLRQRCGYFNFQTVRDGWSNPGLALDKLRDGCERDAVKPESVSGIRHG